MTLKQISNILNTEIIQNMIFGGDAENHQIVAEDLSNIIDVGTAIANLSADQLKDFANKFALGVTKVWFDSRSYKGKSLDIVTDAQEYAGALQRVKGKLFTSYDSDKLSLEDGNNYFDGTFYDFETIAKVYEKEDIFEVRYSIANQMYKTYFTSAENLAKYVALLEQKVADTITVRIHGLEKALLNKLIVESSTNNKIQLITLYNSEHALSSGDTGYLDPTKPKLAINNKDFQYWCASVIERLKSAMGDYNKKFNDGSIETFTPIEDVKVTLLSEFATKNKYANNMTFNKDLTTFNSYNTVDYWQSSTTDLLPSLGDTAKVVEKGTSGNTEVENVVGVIYDKYSIGATLVLNSVTSQYIARGDYNTYFHTIANKYFVDTTNSAVILTLS